MLTTRLTVGIALVSTLMLNVGGAAAQNYPNKPIRIVVAPVGGGNDILARTIAQGISVPLGQPVIVENRPSGIIADTVSKAVPDGYTLLLTGQSLWIAALLEKKPYDPVKDFSPVTIVDKSPNVLVVHQSVATNSVKELIALAKAKPGVLNYASNSIGGTAHLSAELFNAMAGVKIVRINYKGSGPAINDLIGGQVQIMFTSPPSVMPHVKSGKLKALAVTSAEPSAMAPGLPTVAASGLPGYETVPMSIIVAPANTPASIINRLNHEIVRFLSAADVKEKLFNDGSEVVASSPEELAITRKSDIERMGKVIKDAGIKAE